jgi:hypothetical protein
MLEFVSQYSDQFRVMNDKVLRDIRTGDSIEEKLDEVCVELQKLLGKFAEYKGYSHDDSRQRFRENMNPKGKKGTKSTKEETYVNINPTFSRMAVFKFLTNYDGKKTLVNMPIYIPLYFNDYHYYIRGNKYSAPYQLTDSLSYKGKDDSVVLKTVNRAIKISREKTVLFDAHGASYPTHKFFIHINSKKISFLSYHFAYYGFMRTMVYFGCEKFIKLYADCPLEPDPNVIFFKFGKFYLGADRDEFISNMLLRQYIASCLIFNRKQLDEKMIAKVSYWQMQLGAVISEAKAAEKGKQLIITFITSLDDRTRATIKKIEKGFDRESSFAVVRWMFVKYSTLSNKSDSLENKRLRLSEYIIVPFVRDIYQKLYRFLNTPINMRDEKRLFDVFKVSPSIIVNAIIGKTKNKRHVLDIAKYSSHVNDMAFFDGLRYTVSGPQSPIERSGKLAGDSFRTFDPSYVGRIDLAQSSAGSPGISGCLVPFVDLIDETLEFKR